MTVTTKAALAAELRLSKARISQYVKAGMPVRGDGKLNREEALAWISTNQLSQTFEDKGAHRARKLAREPAMKPSPASKVEGYDPEVAVARAIIGPAYAIIAKAALAAGVSIEDAYALSLIASSELDDAAAQALVHCGFRSFGAGFTVGELCSPQNFPEPDWAEIARKSRRHFDEDACERRYEALLTAQEGADHGRATP